MSLYVFSIDRRIITVILVCDEFYEIIFVKSVFNEPVDSIPLHLIE